MNFGVFDSYLFYIKHNKTFPNFKTVSNFLLVKEFLSLWDHGARFVMFSEYCPVWLYAILIFKSCIEETVPKIVLQTLGRERIQQMTRSNIICLKKFYDCHSVVCHCVIVCCNAACSKCYIIKIKINNL